MREMKPLNRVHTAVHLSWATVACRPTRFVFGANLRKLAGQGSVIRCDNGQEYVSSALLEWAAIRGIKIEFIQPGKPEQSAHVERFNRTVQYEWLA